jgi:hypothetical protein
LPRIVARFAPIVIAGLDPAIHQNGMPLLQIEMDARVKPAHDDPQD